MGKINGKNIFLSEINADTNCGGDTLANEDICNMNIILR
jgi:hypothetical protein